MTTAAPPRTFVVAAATRLEARAARAALHDRARVVRVGVGAPRANAGLLAGADVVLSVGLCGALGDGLAAGDAVIPDEVGDGSGRRVACDPETTALLRAAAACAGVRVQTGPMLTVERLATGAARTELARAGWQAADMETMRIAATGAAVAAVRVVLDTPGRELDPRWEHPWRALLDPRLWRQAWWLCADGREYSRLAARIAAAAVT